MVSRALQQYCINVDRSQSTAVARLLHDLDCNLKPLVLHAAREQCDASIDVDVDVDVAFFGETDE